ncbi:nuclear transport factor 2 family protein [Novosphingobium resinovorum]
MTDSRQIARAFFDKLCSGDFMGGFESLAEDATWTIIGDTPLSKHFTRDRLLTEMIPMLSTFREPARMAVSEIIAEETAPS